MLPRIMMFQPLAEGYLLSLYITCVCTFIYVTTQEPYFNGVAVIDSRVESISRYIGRKAVLYNGNGSAMAIDFLLDERKNAIIDLFVGCRFPSMLTKYFYTEQ